MAAKVTLVFEGDDAKAAKTFQRLEDKEKALAKKSEQIAKKQQALTDQTYKKRLQAAQVVSQKDRQEFRIKQARMAKQKQLRDKALTEEQEAAGTRKALTQRQFQDELRAETTISKREQQNIQIQIAREKELARIKKQFSGEEKADGDDRFSDLKSMAAGWVSVGAAIQLATAALRKQNEVRKQGADSLKSGELAIGKLIQQAGSPEQAKKELAEVRKTRLEAGLDLTAAAELQTELGAVGLTGQRKLFASLSNVTGGDAASVARGAGKVQNIFGGTIQQGLNELIAGSRVSEVTLQKFAPNVATAAQATKQIGAGSGETISYIAALTKVTKSADQAAEKLKQFSIGVNKEGFQGLGITGAVEKLQAKGLGDEELEKFLGGKEAVTAYQTVSNAMKLAKQTNSQVKAARAAAGTQESEVNKLLATKETVAPLAAAEALRIQQQRTQVKKEETFGVAQIRRETAVSGVEERALTQGVGQLYAQTAAAETASFLGADEEGIGRVATVAGGFESAGLGGAVAALIAALQENTEEQRGNTTLQRNAQGE